MTSLLLINPQIRTWAEPNCFPSGLATLAAVARQQGHEVTIWDQNVTRTNYQESLDYDFIGIGSLITNYNEVYHLLETYHRQDQGKPEYILGGPITLWKKLPYYLECVDYFVHGEGELPLVDLLNHKPRYEIKGISYYSNIDGVKTTPLPEPIDLSELPLPAYDLWEPSWLETYLQNPIGYLNKRKWIDGSFNSDVKKVKSININTSRGCPYSCRFCSGPTYLGKFRLRPIEHIEEEVKFFVEEHEVGYIHFTDELTFVNQKRIEQIGYLMEDYDVRFGGSMRIMGVTEEKLEFLKESGCVHLGFGIESGSQDVLNRMNKKQRVEKAKQNLILAKNYIKDIDTSFILGWPQEDLSDFLKTKRFCEETRTKPNVVFMATPYPDIWLWEEAKRQGKILNELEYIKSLGEQRELRVNLSCVEDKELLRWQQELLGL